MKCRKMMWRKRMPKEIRRRRRRRRRMRMRRRIRLRMLPKNLGILAGERW
jgi:hypothetical protein